MKTANVSESTTASIAGESDECTFRTNGSTEEHKLSAIMRSFEEKFERSLHEMKIHYDAKCETYEKTVTAISKELFEAQKILKEHDSKLCNVIDGSSTADDQDNLPHTLHFDKDCLRKNHSPDTDSNTAEGTYSVVVHPSDQSQDHLSTYDDTTATPASIERLIRKELRSYMKEVLAERETQTYLIQREMENQNQQIAQLRIEVMSRFRALDLNVKPKAPNHPIPLHCMKFEGTEVEIELIEEGKYAHDRTSTAISKSDPSTENHLALSVVHADDPLIQFTSQVCHTLIMNEAEHLMKTWGTQFDDLTIYLQDNLDKQRECIADVQKSTFEQVDAETQARAGVLNAQLHYLQCKSQQQEKIIQELRDDQERVFHVVVETIIKLKSKLQGMGDQMEQQQREHSSTKHEVTALRQTLIDESNSSMSRFHKQDGRLQRLRESFDHSLKEIEEIVEDRNSIQTILSATIELFNEKMESSNELMGDQLTTTEKRFTKQIEAGEAEIQKINDHQHEMEIVITAICKKLVELTADIAEKKCREAEQILTKPLQGGRTDTSKEYFDYMNVNEKKYKKALWIAGKQRSRLFEVDAAQKEVEFYDLTLAE